MALIDHSIHIAAPVAAVWSLAHDASRRGEWDARIASCEVIPEDADTATSADASIHVGTRLRYALRWLPAVTLPLRAHYAAFVPCERAAIAFDELPWWQLIDSAVGAWHFTPIPEGTLFRSTFRYRLKLGRVGQWVDRLLFQAQVRRDTERSLANLKRIAEESRERTYQ